MTAEQMNLVATLPEKYHAFKVDIDNLIQAQGDVDHPKELARVIPDITCRSK